MTADKRFFKTEFGHDIVIRENYHQTLPQPYNMINRETVYDLTKTADKETDFGVMSDIFEFAKMVDWLDFSGEPKRRFDKLLDVGGATGMVAQLFKLSGRANHVHCLENQDYRNSLDMALVHQSLYEIAICKNEIHSGERQYSPSTYKIIDMLKTLNSLYPSNYRMDNALYPMGAFWQLDHRSDMSLDRFILGDFYDLDEEYDCIVSMSSMDHFAVEPFFNKVRRLLKPGGRCYIWHINWFALLTSTFVWPDFPWGVQRLTRADLIRYFNEFRPSETENALRCLDYWHKGETPGMTLEDYVQVAAAAGLTPVNSCRLAHHGGLRLEQANWRFQGDHGPSIMREVLRDINHFNWSF